MKYYVPAFLFLYSFYVFLRQTADMAPPPAQPPSGRHVAVAVSGAVVSVSFYEYNYEYMNTVFGPDTRYWYQYGSIPSINTGMC